jgi:hypothetical protein
MKSIVELSKLCLLFGITEKVDINPKIHSATSSHNQALEPSEKRKARGEVHALALAFGIKCFFF